MEVAGKELDNQQALCGAEAHVLAPEIDDSAEHATHDSAERAGAASNPIASREHARKRVMNKRKEKVDEKMKEPMFIGDIPLVNLDDYDVTQNKLLCNSSDSDDDDSPNVDGVGVCDGPRLCLQAMDSNVEFASRSMVPKVREYSEPHTTSTTSIHDPLFNAVGKAPHLDAVIIKQEAGWFQLWVEKQ